MTALRALLFPRLSDAALAERAAPYRADLAKWLEAVEVAV